MTKIIHLVISDDTFGGFEHYVRLTGDITSNNQLISLIISKLISTLKLYNLDILCNMVHIKKFHIHDLTFNNIKNQNDTTIYICSHED